MQFNPHSSRNLLGIILALEAGTSPVPAQEKRTNIPILWGDEIGIWSVSQNSRVMMRHQTPGIDHLVREGLAFADHGGQQSCGGASDRWRELFTGLHAPLHFNQRRDPFEHAERNANTCHDSFPDRAFGLLRRKQLAGKILRTMKTCRQA
ncbi:MAG: hypothetical protein ACKVYV_04575 [Limisphaerales bacterium]